MSTTAKTVFESLLGAWTFDRHITGKNGGSMSGSAIFTNAFEDNRLEYKEHGEHNLFGNKQTEFTQRYTYHLNDDDISVYNHSDEKMLNLHFGDNSMGCGEYMCAADKYAAELEFQDNNSFVLKYDVKGPNKDYTITTNFKRVTSPILNTMPN